MQRAEGQQASEMRTVAMLALGAVLVVIVGTVGYMLIEGWSLLDALYMTVITLTTVGFSEVASALAARPSVHHRACWSCGVTLIGLGLRSLIEFMVSGTLTGMFRRRAVRKQVGELTGALHHLRVRARGRSGGPGVRREQALVRRDRQRSRTVAQIVESGYLGVEGDASEDETLLEEAGIEQALGLVAAVDSDADTIFVILSARVLNPRLTIIARAASEESVGKLRRAGADQVISPYSIGGKKMATLMLKPLVSDYLEVVTGGGEIEFRLEEFALNDTCEVVGRSIEDLDIRRTDGRHDPCRSTWRLGPVRHQPRSGPRAGRRPTYSSRSGLRST